MLQESESAPSDLTNYVHNGFRGRDPWQACVVGLAELDSGHMLLATNVTLSCLWNESVLAWQLARKRASEVRAEELETRQTSPKKGGDGREPNIGVNDVADDTQINSPKHHRVIAFQNRARSLTRYS
jgi:hypothetical protein